MTIHECPMCATDFDGNTCPSSCPMATGCNMVRCPRCGHEFVDEGMVASFVKKLLASIRSGERGAESGDVVDARTSLPPPRSPLTH